MSEPKVIEGAAFSDARGKLSFNNAFDALPVKRIYFIENCDTDFVRAWQGHKIEQRWFSAVTGSFEIRLVCVDNWEAPSKNLEQKIFRLSAERFDLLHVPKGYISSIRSLEDGSKLLSMSDYLLGEVNDEYRFDTLYFK
ncbi:MAG: WxcM-like domain-containing protein [Bacteroidota bacterium]